MCSARRKANFDRRKWEAAFSVTSYCSQLPVECDQQGGRTQSHRCNSNSARGGSDLHGGRLHIATEPPSRVRRRRRSKLTFSQYLRFRLGTSGGRTAWFNFFIRPFGAASFAEFWRLWNPAYGYFLSYYCYRPLATILPRQAALLITFATCGFVLHDLPAWAVTRTILPPGGTIVFINFGLGVILGEAFKMDLSRWTLGARAAVNVGYLVSCVSAMLLMVLKLLP